jgi:hypothetical protein
VTGGRLFSAGTPVSSNKTDRQDEILSIVETVGKHHKPTPTKKEIKQQNKTNKKNKKKPQENPHIYLLFIVCPFFPFFFFLTFSDLRFGVFKLLFVYYAIFISL